MFILSGHSSIYKPQSKEIQCISSEPIFHLYFVVLLYKAQASLMYVVYSAKGTFCTKHPYQRTIGKLRFNKRGKYKIFLVSSHPVDTRRRFSICKTSIRRRRRRIDAL